MMVAEIERNPTPRLRARGSSFLGSIDRRLILYGAGIVLLAGLVSATLLGVLLDRVETDRVGDAAQNLVTLAAGQVASEVDGLTDRAASIALDIQALSAATDSGTPIDLTELGRRVLLLDENVQALQIRLDSRQGTVLGGAGTLPQTSYLVFRRDDLGIGEDVTTHPSTLVAKLLDRTIATGHSQVLAHDFGDETETSSDATEGVPSLMTTAPILRDGVPIGSVGIIVSLDRLTRDIGPLPLALHGRILIADDRLDWVQAPSGRFERGSLYRLMRILLVPGISRLGDLIIDGVGYDAWATEASFAKTAVQWAVVLVVPRKDLNDTIRSLFARCVLIGIGLSLVSTLFFMSVGRSIGRPIAAFTETVRKLAADVVDVEIDPAYRHRTDEIGEMGQALAVLREHEVQRRDLNRLQEKYLQEIETRVAQRTAELSRALDDLYHTKDELVRSEKLAALGGMVAAVSHEVNTPVGNAYVVASTMRERMMETERALEAGTLKKSGVQGMIQDMLSGTELLVRNLDRAAALVKSFKQVAMDRTSDRRRAFELAQTVSEIVETLRPRYKHRKVQILIDIPPEIAIDSYPGPFGQVVTNMIENAFLHAFEPDAAGAIRIITREPAGAEGEVELTFADDGQGIPADQLPKIFDPFFTTRFGQGGSGLGLHIVHNIVYGVLGGKLEVESTPGRGTRFILRLPRAAPTMPPEAV
jgi:signal transduction histidine kinase